MKNISKVQENGLVVSNRSGWFKRTYEGIKRVLKSRIGAALISTMGILGWTNAAEANNDEKKDSVHSVHFKGITGEKEVTFFPRVAEGVDIGIIGPGEVDVDLSELEESVDGKKCLTQKVCAETKAGNVRFKKWDLSGEERNEGKKCLDVKSGSLILIHSESEQKNEEMPYVSTQPGGFVQKNKSENDSKQKSLRLLATVAKDLESVWKRANTEGEQVFDGSYEKTVQDEKLVWSKQWRAGNIKFNRNLNAAIAFHRNQIRADAMLKAKNAAELKLKKEILDKLNELIEKSVMTETGEWKRIRPNDLVTAQDVAEELKDLIVKIEDDPSVKIQAGSSGGSGGSISTGSQIGMGGLAAVGGKKAWVVNFAGAGPNIPGSLKSADLVKGLDLNNPQYRNYVRKVMADTIKKTREEDLVDKLLTALLKSVMAESDELKRVSPTEAVTPKEGAENLRNLFDYIDEYRKNKAANQKEKEFNQIFSDFHNKVCTKMAEEIGNDVGLSNLSCSMEFTELNGKKAVKVFVDAPNRGLKNVLIVQKRDDVQKNPEEINSSNYIITVDGAEVQNIDEGVKKIANNWRMQVLPPKINPDFFEKMKSWWNGVKSWWRKGL